MTKTYKLELEIVLDEEQQKRVVELARRLYAANPGSTEDDNGVVREISAEEFIDGTSRALMTVAEEIHFGKRLTFKSASFRVPIPTMRQVTTMSSAPPIPMRRKSGRRERRKRRMKKR